jgi:hypothetical protein
MIQFVPVERDAAEESIVLVLKRRASAGLPQPAVRSCGDGSAARGGLVVERSMFARSKFCAKEVAVAVTKLKRTPCSPVALPQVRVAST